MTEEAPAALDDAGSPVSPDVETPATDEAPPVPQRPAAQHPVRRQPLWTYFLTPAAIVVGSIIIAATIWYVDDDGAADSAHSAASTTGAESLAPGSVASTPPPAAQDLLTTFTGYARQVGLDQGKFQQCLNKQENVQIINRHLQRGSSLGVNGTPTFFINNKRVVGAQPAAVFDEIIAAELKGSPTTLDGYSQNIKQLAATNPPRFEILPSKVDVSDAAIEGNANAKVLVAEFSDFQCPFCKRWNDDYLKKLRTQVAAGDVALAFLHFPITQIHANAGNASMAAICAGEQGKFWQMHDLLFARQDEWAAASN